MSEDRSWGADTVAFGRASREASPAPQPARPGRPKLPTIALRPLALVTFAIVAAVALIIAAGDGSDAQKAPIRGATDPAPRVVKEQAPRVHRPEPRDAMKLHGPQADAAQHGRKREPVESAVTQGQTVPEPPAEPEPEYVAPPAPEPASPPTPTPPAAEFGL